MSGAATRHRAILLLGPTGSGKTPLGDLIERRGLAGAPCLHFDFGANLRRIVERDRPDEHLGREEIDFLRRVLPSGALLENERFSIAERVLRSLLAPNERPGLFQVELPGILPLQKGQRLLGGVLRGPEIVVGRSGQRRVVAVKHGIGMIDRVKQGNHFPTVRDRRVALQAANAPSFTTGNARVNMSRRRGDATMAAQDRSQPQPSRP